MKKTPAKAKKGSAPDREAAGRDYRTGAFTDRELAAKYGVSHTTIQNWAKRHGWTKDLVGSVKAATAAKLAAHEVEKMAGAAVAKVVAKSLGSEVVATTEAVAAVAEVNTRVILRQRSDLMGLRDEADAALRELRWQRENLPALENLAELVAAESGNPEVAAQRLAMFHRVVGLSSRIKSLKDLGDTTTKLQQAERVAFSLDKDGGNGRGLFEQILDDIADELGPH